MSATYRPMQIESLAMKMANQGWIIHPQKGKIKFIARPFQRKFWTDSSKRRIVVKARQIGMSQAVGAEAIDRAMERTCTILMISRNEDQAMQLLGYCKTIYNNLDNRPVLLTRENTRRMAFANGSEIVSLPANKSTGRGFAASHVYFDEAAWAMYANQIWQSIAPSIALGGTITVLSSPNGPDNLFGEICEGKRGATRVYDGTPAPDGIWSYHHIPWTENPAYTTEDPNWLTNNRDNYGDDEWASEFLASLEGSGERVFDKEKLDQMPDGWLEREWDELIDDDIFHIDPIPGHRYVTAADLGRKHDPFVIVALDVTQDTHHVVAFERYHKMDFDLQEERIETFEASYPGWSVMDASGLGDPVWQALQLKGSAVMPFVFSRTSKPDMVNELIRSTHHGILKCGVRPILEEMDRYRRKDDKLKQDAVMALGMAEYTSRHIEYEQTIETDERIEDVSRAFRGE